MKDALPSNTYGEKKYYYNLTAIAVVLSKVFATEHTFSRGWVKVPLNKSDAKIKIIGLLVAICKEENNGVFKLG